MTEDEEAVLIRRCQAGDKTAFRTLVEKYRTVMFGTAFLMTRDHILAEDALQEALVRIWKNLPSLRRQGSLKAWLVRIVINEVNGQMRKKRLPSVSLENAVEIKADCDEVATKLIRSEEHQRLRQAIESLSPEHKQTIILRYFSDLTVPEVARAMGKREGTIKSRLSRALNRLHEIIVNDEIYEGRR